MAARPRPELYFSGLGFRSSHGALRGPERTSIVGVKLPRVLTASFRKTYTYLSTYIYICIQTYIYICMYLYLYTFCVHVYVYVYV